MPKKPSIKHGLEQIEIDQLAFHLVHKLGRETALETLSLLKNENDPDINKRIIDAIIDKKNISRRLMSEIDLNEENLSQELSGIGAQALQNTVDRHIGFRVKEARLTSGKNLIKLANLLNVSVKTLNQYEQGKSHIPLKILELISNILHKPITYFFEGMQRKPMVTQIIYNHSHSLH